MTRDNLLQQIKVRLSELYGSRMAGLILYGSEARGESDSESDIDLLVLLNGPVEFVSDLRRIIDALYPLVLEELRPIHALPVDIDTYRAQEFGLYRNARKEGIPIQ